LKSGSTLETVLEERKFAVTAEVGPPRGADIEAVRVKAEHLRGYVDAVNVTDNQSAMVRMSSLAASILLSQMGIEPVYQIVSRDRNRLAIQSDVLGAAAMGIKNVLCLSGDHHSFGDHPHAKGVYDIDSVQMIHVLRTMRDRGRLMSGKKLTQAPKIFIGGVANPFGEPVELRVMRLEKKVNAGADFIQTQVVFDTERFDLWMDMVRELGLHRRVHILAGVVPLISLKMAEILRDRVPGVSVPEHIIERMKRAQDPQEEGISIALEVMDHLRKVDGLHGIHIMAITWEHVVPRLVEEAGLRRVSSSATFEVDIKSKED